jgi:acetyl esterase/lipase
MSTLTKSSGPVPYLSDEHLTPGVKAFLKVANSGAPVESLPKLAARQVLIDAQKAFKVDYSGITESEKEIQADGFTIKLNIVKPEGAKDELPVFIFIHGGGWILGDYPTHKRLVRDLVVESGFTSVFVNYTPSPEAHYPQSINEIYAATKWVAANGKEIGVDGSKLAVVGNSVGALWCGQIPDHSADEMDVGSVYHRSRSPQGASRLVVECHHGAAARVAAGADPGCGERYPAR